ncbi:MAG: MATE family efflux transporter [Bryobacteraceae bacterium]
MSRLGEQFRSELPAMFRLAWPLILAELGWMTMGVVDVMMVGRVSKDAIAGVSMGSIIFYTVGIFGTGLLLGLDTLVSQAFGAGDVDDCHRSLVHGIYISLAVTPALMGVVWLCGPLLPVFKLHPDVIREALPYMDAVNWSLPSLMLYTALRRYLQAMDLVRPITFALLSANLINVAANWALIYGNAGAPALGAAGAGWATTISRLYMFAALLGYVWWRDRRQHTTLRATSLRLEPARLRRLLELGLPAALQPAVEVGVFAAAGALIGRLGTGPLAAHQIALNCAGMTFMIPYGLGSAGAVRVGQAIGRGDIAGARRAGSTALLLGAGFMSCAAVTFWVVPGQIIRAFTTDTSIVDLAVSLLIIAAFFQLFDGLQAVATGNLRGAGDTRTATLCHFAGYWIVGLPLGWYLCFSRGWGAAGVWTGLCVALILIGIVLLVAWSRAVRALVPVAA